MTFKKLITVLCIFVISCTVMFGCGTSAGESDGTAGNNDNVTVDPDSLLQGYSDYTHHNLVWADEFNGTELNLQNWCFDIGTGNNGWGNGEEQYYTDSNHKVENGMLTITAKEEEYQGSNYTSTKIKTRGLQTFTYGRIESRISLPIGDGLWPAFWMLSEPIEGSADGSTNSEYGTWPACGEIDIMEAKGRYPEESTSAIHYGSTSAQGSYIHQYQHETYKFKDGETINDWHTYSVEWYELYGTVRMRMYVDDIMYKEYTSSSWWSGGDTDNPNAPFDIPFYIILNLAVGGMFDGYVTPDSEDMPAEMKVDYVRVYSQDAFTIQDFAR